MVNTFGTGKLSEKDVSPLIRKVFPLSPKGMIEHLGLRRPIFAKTAVFGHFGWPEFPWEKLDAVEEVLTNVDRRRVVLKA